MRQVGVWKQRVRLLVAPIPASAKRHSRDFLAWVF
jgi:hypothetical protein